MKNLKGKNAIYFNRLDSSGKTITLEDNKGNWLLMIFHRHLG